MKGIPVLIAATLLLAGCGGGSDDAESSMPRGLTGTTIKIGTHTDLSGPLAIWGVPMVNGMRMRFEELAAVGGVHGRTIDFVVEDNQYQVPVAVKSVNKLLNVDEIFAMLGAMGTPHNNAAFARMFEANVPSLFPLTAAESMYEPLHPLKFSYFVSYQNQVRGGMTYMVEQHGVQKVCLQSPGTDYGSEVAEGYAMAVEELGLESVYVGRHKGSETDFVGTATSIKNSGCELLLLGAFVKDTILLYTGVRDAGWDGVVLTNMVPYLPEIPPAADGGMEGMYAAAPFLVPNFTDLEEGSWGRGWYENYVSDHGEEPAAQSVIGYVIADLLVKSLEAAGRDLTVEKLIEAMESIDYYEDPFGGPSLSFGPEKHVASDSLNLYQVVEWRWQTVAEALPY
ncbi:MAG: ABC transporter substrate-binding protein [Gammaproteobacteria bacterium]|nr:ABC transporter substrate-binding protein [Gammaproteobacteria bacterium]